jgi:hypothetical protein
METKGGNYDEKEIEKKEIRRYGNDCYQRDWYQEQYQDLHKRQQRHQEISKALRPMRDNLEIVG